MPWKSDSDWERRRLRLAACLLRAFTAHTSILGSLVLLKPGEAAVGAMAGPELVPTNNYIS